MNTQKPALAKSTANVVSTFNPYQEKRLTELLVALSFRYDMGQGKQLATGLPHIDHCLMCGEEAASWKEKLVAWSALQRLLPAFTGWELTERAWMFMRFMDDYPCMTPRQILEEAAALLEENDQRLIK